MGLSDDLLRFGRPYSAYDALLNSDGLQNRAAHQYSCRCVAGAELSALCCPIHAAYHTQIRESMAAQQDYVNKISKSNHYFDSMDSVNKSNCSHGKEDGNIIDAEFEEVKDNIKLLEEAI